LCFPEMKTKIPHNCVDYCQPPEHADLAFSVAYDDDPVANHCGFANDYWYRFGVVVTKVERLPEWDGRSPDPAPDGRKRVGISLETGKPLPDDKVGLSNHRAYMVRWRDDIEREHDWRKREATIRAIYDKGK